MVLTKGIEQTFPMEESPEWGIWGGARHRETNHSNMVNKMLLATENMCTEIAGKSRSLI